jgi:voltage-gated potassium channel
MTQPLDTGSGSERRRTWENGLAGPMFFLALAFLVVLAGLIHRFPRLDRVGLEMYLILGTLAVLWLVFLVEAAIRFRLRDTGRPAWRALVGVAVVALLPPLRLGCRSQVRPEHLWLPGLGWSPIDAALRRKLERWFSVPMICFALLVLPLFAIEYYWAAEIRSEPLLGWWLDVGTSVIWLAFTVELIVMVAVSERPVRYCFVHWIDVAIVLLPVVEVLPLFRMLRLGRVMRLEQLLRWGRLHRVHALVTRGWRALLLLQLVQRLTGRSPEHRLRQLRELLQAREEELADVRREIAELEELIARTAAAFSPLTPPAGPS